VLEDLHWADDSTWNFVTYAARRVRRLPLVFVVTYRDEEIPATDRGGHGWPHSGGSRT
jgi:predicted ATPase